jgi:hypothetical protein
VEADDEAEQTDSEREAAALNEIELIEAESDDTRLPTTTRYIRILAVLLEYDFLTRYDAARMAQLINSQHTLSCAALLAFTHNHDIADLVETIKEILTRVERAQQKHNNSAFTQQSINASLDAELNDSNFVDSTLNDSNIGASSGPQDDGEFVDSTEADQAEYDNELNQSVRSAPSRRPSYATAFDNSFIDDNNGGVDDSNVSETDYAAMQILEELCSLLPTDISFTPIQYQQLHELIIERDPVLFAALQTYKEQSARHSNSADRRNINRMTSQLGDTILKRLQTYFNEPISTKQQKWKAAQKKKQLAELAAARAEQALKRVNEAEEPEDDEDDSNSRRKNNNSNPSSNEDSSNNSDVADELQIISMLQSAQVFDPSQAKSLSQLVHLRDPQIMTAFHAAKNNKKWQV